MKVILNLTFVVDINPEGLVPPLSISQLSDKIRYQFSRAHIVNFWFDHEFALAKFITDGIDRVKTCSVIVLQDDSNDR